MTSGVNRKKDKNLSIKVQMISMGVYDADTINNLFVNEGYYFNNYTNVNYDLFPKAKTNGYNSNSFAQGLLLSTDITPQTPNYKVPGWIKPLPRPFFGL